MHIINAENFTIFFFCVNINIVDESIFIKIYVKLNFFKNVLLFICRIEKKENKSFGDRHKDSFCFFFFIDLSNFHTSITL